MSHTIRCSVRLLSQQKTSQKLFLFILFFPASALVYTPKVTLALCLYEEKDQVTDAPASRSFILSLCQIRPFKMLKLDATFRTNLRSHLKDQLVLQRPCYGHLVYPELAFHFLLNWKTKIISNQACILTRPHGFSCQNFHAFHLMTALEIKVKQVNLTDWLLQQKCGSRWQY